MRKITTQQDALLHVLGEIMMSGIAPASAYDLDAILRALYDLAGGWDFRKIDRDAFWLILADNER